MMQTLDSGIHSQLGELANSTKSQDDELRHELNQIQNSLNRIVGRMGSAEYQLNDHRVRINRINYNLRKNNIKIYWEDGKPTPNSK